ncbi:uncharacterized protein EI90DRAFT_3145331 [Cantharellus anzutake]|uniref:uncharacterized protein n=1 Tax=Cantharellus anzutake TaxID=1750568 RepID=UPI0019033F7C|nr:uncharacterized protein EI90DRAFT_3145331 [Cantharellus anzutake]KAF8332612.1 hypothetical protein EI90DRAFT_3145331 [Cantharellus anzutake]
MSMSPRSSNSDGGPPPNKRKRSYAGTNSAGYDNSRANNEEQPRNGIRYNNPPPPSSQPMNHVPKRGSRACTNCRRGKNRCEFEGEGPCRRCKLANLPCIFEKPERKPTLPPTTSIAVERVSNLENQFMSMQSQIIAMQSTLDRILSTIQGGITLPAISHSPTHYVSNSNGHSHNDCAHIERLYSPALPNSSLIPSSATRSTTGLDSRQLFQEESHLRGSVENGYAVPNRQQNFPPLPGFAPPPHKYATYGIVPSTTPSSEDESEDTLPRASLNAPIEALQGLANAAAEVAAASSLSSSRAPKLLSRKRVEPIPRNAFPSVVDKGLVSETEARELYHIFFSGCHLFIPLFDPSYDTFESLRSRTPFCFDSILAVASKIRAGNGQPTQTHYHCLENAQGIARSTLFGPIVRKEAVQAMLLLAAWSPSGWLPGGHAIRMALDLGLHRALEKLADTDPNVPIKKRSEDEERDLVVSARIWLCLYWFDHQMSLGTGRPVILRGGNSVKYCGILLTHPMASPTDVRLISQIELIAQKSQIHETLLSMNGQVDNSTLAFVRRASIALDKWWEECDELHRTTMDPESLLRKILAGDLHYAKLWLICVILRGASWDKMSYEQRDLAFQAKEAASDCLNTFLGSPAYRAALRYAVHDSLVTAAFSGLFLLKMANLFPREVDLSGIIVQVEQLAQLFTEVAAERYALTLRLMIANLRRKVGLATGQQTPVHQEHDLAAVASSGISLDHSHFAEHTASNDELGTVPAQASLPPVRLQDLTSSYASDMMFSTATIPMWLQETSLTDLSLPVNGSDGIFLPIGFSNQWPGDARTYQAY